MEKAQSRFAKYGKVLSFFSLEILAFISFSLGSSYLLYSFLCLALFILLLIVHFHEIRKEGFTSFAMFLFPLFIYGLLSVISYFTKDPFFAPSGLMTFFLPVGMVVVASCGYINAHEKTFDISKAFLVIYSALALYVFINLVATMIQFAPFHTIRYAGKYLYYDGLISDTQVSQMAYGLIGFSFEEISIGYYLMFPVMLLTSAIFLFYVKYKENKKLFLIYLAYTILAALTIILSISKYMLIIIMVVILIVAYFLLYHFKVLKPKAFKIINITAVSLVGLGILVMILNSQYAAVEDNMRIGFIQNLISNNSLLNKIFNSNPISKRYSVALDGIFTNFKMFGTFTGKVQGFTNTYSFVERYGERFEIYPTGSWFFDNVLTAGTFGTLFFIGAFIFAVVNLIKYYKNSEDLEQNKALIMVFLIALFAYCFVSYDMSPLIFKKHYYPFNTNNLFMLSLFLVGYCFYKNNPKKEEPVKEVVNEEPQEDSEEGGKEDEEVAL